MKVTRRLAKSPSPKLPHERDESPELSVGVQPAMEQAAADVASGQVDTDSYTRATETAKVAEQHQRPGLRKRKPPSINRR